MDAVKSRFGSTIQNKATQLALLAGDLKHIFESYFDRQYGGSDPITEEDLGDIGITPGQIAAFITLAENYGKFLNNEAPFQSDYMSTLNNIRTDI